MYVNINRVMTVAQRLCDAGHYAAPSIRLQANKLDKDWRTFAAALLATVCRSHAKKMESCTIFFKNAADCLQPPTTPSTNLFPLLIFNF